MLASSGYRSFPYRSDLFEPDEQYATDEDAGVSPASRALIDSAREQILLDVPRSAIPGLKVLVSRRSG